MHIVNMINESIYPIIDPSALICLSYDTLKELPPSIDAKHFDDQWYTHGTQSSLTYNFTLTSSSSAISPGYCDVNKYNILQETKDQYSNFDENIFNKARNYANPFEKIGNSIFINRAAIKLANIDAVHKISRPGQTCDITFENKSIDEHLTYCDIAAGPGSFTQYLQYRFPNSHGYGITLRHPTLDWSVNYIDMKRFEAFYGTDGKDGKGTGDLYVNWLPFINFVASKHPEGVDLVTGDGGLDVQDRSDKNEVRKQEFKSSRLLLAQTIVGIKCVRPGGNFVVKVFDTVTTISAHTLYILAQCFHKILIFKPVSSRPANSERYIICINRHRNIESYYQILAKAANTYTNEQFLSTLFLETPASTFMDWLTKTNNQSIDRQLTTANNIIWYATSLIAPTDNNRLNFLLSDPRIKLFLNWLKINNPELYEKFITFSPLGQPPYIPQYNIEKFPIIWNLPETPVKQYRNPNNKPRGKSTRTSYRK
jgi:23S rRNA U2552 (ribose-2'-O)-methylase RlmE/FtsJ